MDLDFVNSPEELYLVCVIVGIALIVGTFIQCLFLRTLGRALERCSEENRKMQPGQVWLNLIPLFGAIWMFFTMIRVSESLKAEFRDRGEDEEGDFGQKIGIASCVLNLIGMIPYLGGLTGTISFVLWVTYWTKINGYAQRLESNHSRGRRYRTASARYYR